MFEPVHGSAPDVPGRAFQSDRADLVGGHDARPPRPQGCGGRIVVAIEKLLKDTDVRTRDMGGKAMCTELGDTIVELVKAG